MQLNECKGKNIVVTCTDGVVIKGYCDEYLSQEEAFAEDLPEACIYLQSDSNLIEIYQSEISKIDIQ